MSLWNKKPLKVYGGRMSESMLAILCNIIKGENVVKERLAKEREEMGDSTNSSAVAGPSTSGGAAAAAAAAASPAVPMSNWASNENDVNEAHLQQVKGWQVQCSKDKVISYGTNATTAVQNHEKDPFCCTIRESFNVYVNAGL